jgi:chromate transporter
MTGVLLQIYVATVQVAFLSFGGIYSFWSLLQERVVVDCAGHAVAAAATVCRDEFRTVFGVSELLPGPRVNPAAILGFEMAGFPGMLVFLLGLLTPGIVLTPAVFAVYRKYRDYRPLAVFFQGTGIAILAILLTFFVKIAGGALAGGALHALASALPVALVFALSYKNHVHPMLAVAGGGVYGYFLLQ